MTTLKWIAFFPIAAFTGLFVGGLILLGGNYLVGKWAIPSGFVIYIGSAMIPAMWVTAGLQVAPKKSHAVKWVLLSPLLLFCILLAIGLVSLVFGSSPPEKNLLGESLSNSLSIFWQMVLYDAGFIIGTIFIVAKSPDEIIK